MGKIDVIYNGDSLQNSLDELIGNIKKVSNNQLIFCIASFGIHFFKIYSELSSTCKCPHCKHKGKIAEAIMELLNDLAEDSISALASLNSLESLTELKMVDSIKIREKKKYKKEGK